MQAAWCSATRLPAELRRARRSATLTDDSSPRKTSIGGDRRNSTTAPASADRSRRQVRPPAAGPTGPPSAPTCWATSTDSEAPRRSADLPVHYPPPSRTRARAALEAQVGRCRSRYGRVIDEAATPMRAGSRLLCASSGTMLEVRGRVPSYRRIARDTAGSVRGGYDGRGFDVGSTTHGTGCRAWPTGSMRSVDGSRSSAHRASEPPSPEPWSSRRARRCRRPAPAARCRRTGSRCARGGPGREGPRRATRTEPSGSARWR